MKLFGPIILAAACAFAQQPVLQPPPPPVTEGSVVVPNGTRIPLQLINRISTKNAHEGDQLYLTTAYPIVINSQIVIPPGSYVKGTITQTKRPGRVAGKGELYIRFDSLTLPNGVTRDFRGRVGAIDGSSSDTLNRKEGKIESDTAKGKDAATIGEVGAAGASIGGLAARSVSGAGIGAGAGVLVGIAAVLLTRGPDATLERGSTVDMILDRDVAFRPDELNFSGAGYHPAASIPPPSSSINPVINPARGPRQ